MQWNNTSTHYGVITKFFHWAVFLIFANQYIVARIMMNLPQGETFWGFTQGFFYNWHKSFGMIVLGLALLRYVWRRTTRLPDWHKTLTQGEIKAIHIIEPVLYWCMILMPLSGYFFVMAGGYGINFFGQWEWFNPIGKQETLASISHWTHIILGWTILIAVGAHLILGIRHSIIFKSGYLKRIFPFVQQA